MRRLFAAFLGIATVGLFWGQTAGAAPGYLYDCDMTEAASSQGWISSKVAVIVPGDGTAKVVDGVILYFNGKPMEAVVLRDNAKRLAVKWSLRNTRSDRGTSFSYFDYRASISKATGKIELTAIPRHFDSGVRSTGQCSKRVEK